MLRIARKFGAENGGADPWSDSPKTTARFLSPHGYFCLIHNIMIKQRISQIACVAAWSVAAGGTNQVTIDPSDSVEPVSFVYDTDHTANLTEVVGDFRISDPAASSPAHGMFAIFEDTFESGTWENDEDYWENRVPGTARFHVSQPAVNYYWERIDDSGNLVTMMELDSSGGLTLMNDLSFAGGSLHLSGDRINLNGVQVLDDKSVLNVIHRTQTHGLAIFPGNPNLADPYAVGFESFSVGGNAHGEASVSFGGDAEGDNSVAFDGRAAGGHSFSAGPAVSDHDGTVVSLAQGESSFVFGKMARALGAHSMAFGLGYFTGETGDIDETNVNDANYFPVDAVGAHSLAFGYSNRALGDHSLAFGRNVEASGAYGVAFGKQTRADAVHAFVVGRHNVGGGSGEHWIAEDPVFEIGVGTAAAPKNAVTVHKSGDALFSENLKVKGDMSVAGRITLAAPQGDIPMFGQ